MKYWKNLRIGKKLGVGFGFLLILMLIIGVTVYWGLTQIKAAEKQMELRYSQLQVLKTNELQAVKKFQIIADTVIKQDLVNARKEFAKLNDQMEATGVEADAACDSPQEAAWMEEFDAANEGLDKLYSEQLLPEIEYIKTNTLQNLDEQSDSLIAEAESYGQKIRTAFQEELNAVIQSKKVDEIQQRVNSLHAIDMYMFWLVKKYQVQADLIINHDVSASQEIYKNTSVEFDQYKKQLLSSADTPEEKEWLAKSNQLSSDFDALFHNGVITAVKHDNEKRILKLDELTDENISLMQDRMEKIVGSIQQDVDAAKTELIEINEFVLITTIVLSLFALIIGVAIALLISKGITVPLTKGVQFAKAVADGDLSQHIELDQKDEIGALVNALNRMSQNLRQAMSSIQTSAEQVAASSEELSSSAQNLSSASTEQATSLEETSASVQQLAKSIEQSAANAKKADGLVGEATTLSNQSLNVAREGMNKVKQMNESMDNIQTSSKEIARVIDVINDIADQTN
ncbi:methyl-accepting chemotaxis protein, partial [bacterium]|nr:methyl-accepting chemotaxis protein [bacterium]